MVLALAKPNKFFESNIECKIQWWDSKGKWFLLHQGCNSSDKFAKYFRWINKNCVVFFIVAEEVKEKMLRFNLIINSNCGFGGVPSCLLRNYAAL